MNELTPFILTAFDLKFESGIYCEEREMENYYMVNDKRINIKGYNKYRIRNIGDRNRINIQRHSGSVEVVGNHCNVNISEITSDAHVTLIVRMWHPLGIAAIMVPYISSINIPISLETMGRRRNRT